ncbi:piggyBac transposable element-derived protein 3-like [Salvelinus fontinalis]|uniref:piggyBac transposable element-derived protein 3-like n=1 Tax=Salvelinus fontinalis TaxID=8038 RepID=UPI0024864D42|nr:piggyBac transposable element-derived protein 3-like [Salvelinus fontinalis]
MTYPSQPPLTTIPPPPPPSTVDNEEPTASTRQRVQSEEPRAKLQVVKIKDRVFKRSKRPATAVIPKHIVYSPNAAECVKQSCPNPMDVFLLMYPPTLREITIEMSNLYSTQTKDEQLYLSMDELLTFYGILITSGYSSVPRRHMYWSLDSDVHNESISDSMRRNRFDEIMASVHVVDNTKITDDPFFKVRPIFSELNQSYKVMPFQEWLSVDESMIRYYGRHGCKQFIRGKPIRFGHKLWSLASPSGYMYHMEPYGGSHTLLPETGLGQGPSVVLGLAEQSQVPQGCKFLHDNLFTSLALLDEMTKRGYGSSGTMRQNRLFDVPFKPQKDFMKLPRGTSEVLTQGDKLLVRWKDNNIVTVATNMEEKYSETSVKRCNKERRAFDKVPQPKCINQYNEHMGGVDLHDLQVSRYHISIRSKKWWWPIFAWSLNSALVNSHFFYRDVMGGTIDLLTFSRIVAQSLMQKFGMKPLSQGRRSLLAATVEDQWPPVGTLGVPDGVPWPLKAALLVPAGSCGSPSSPSSPDQGAPGSSSLVA